MTSDRSTEIPQPAARPANWHRIMLVLGIAIVAALAAAFPQIARETLVFTLRSLAWMAPIIAFAILLSAWVRASGADMALNRLFEGRIGWSIVAASAFGAVTPICGVGVLPIIAGLLGAGVPLAPIMAFWLASPITDPAMLTITAGTLGLTFAIGKTVIAAAIGLAGGFATMALMRRGAFADPLRQNRIAAAADACCASETIVFAFWREPQRRAVFRANAVDGARLVIAWLTLAFALEALIVRFVPADLVTRIAGDDNIWAIPGAVLVGTPLYIDGYASLPMVRGLLDLGMSQGASMALLVAGGITSLYASVAVFALVRWPVFALYIALAVIGALAAGYAFEAVAA